MSLEKTSVENTINTKPVYRLKTSAPPSSDPLEQEAAGGSRRQQEEAGRSRKTAEMGLLFGLGLFAGAWGILMLLHSYTQIGLKDLKQRMVTQFKI